MFYLKMGNYFPKDFKMNRLETYILILVFCSCMSVAAFTVGRFYSPAYCQVGIDFCQCQTLQGKDIACRTQVEYKAKK